MGPMEAVLVALSSPRRREILRLVWDAERSSGDIAGRLGASPPSVSRSLRALREAGVVRERRSGTKRYYRADRRALRGLEPFLKSMWATGLERLDVAAREETRRKRGRS